MAAAFQLLIQDGTNLQHAPHEIGQTRRAAN
jgi:hypothetical protein